MQFRCHPRAGYPERIAGGVIAASRVSKEGPFEDLFTLDPKDPHNPEECGGSLTIKLNSGHGPWNWLRYQGPPGSHSNIASLEFDGEHVQHGNYCNGESSEQESLSKLSN